MARVYVSSTFNDLVSHRAAVIAALRQAGHELAVMEDYPAFDERPAEKCVVDVATCDLYVGIVAFRYGFIPPQNNPECASITEMEYTAAKDKKRLIFQLHPDAHWPRKFSDEISGEAERGRCIERFRAHLANEHGNRYFDSPENLATQVLAAVSSLGHPSSARIPSDVSQLIVSLSLQLHEREQQLQQRDRQIELLTQRLNQSRSLDPQWMEFKPAGGQGVQ